MPRKEMRQDIDIVQPELVVNLPLPTADELQEALAELPDDEPEHKSRLEWLIYSPQRIILQLEDSGGDIDEFCRAVGGVPLYQFPPATCCES